jgi:ectoine hydroxylase-related dioxygenase (phytanoyl-CoA dioxygenase family)
MKGREMAVAHHKLSGSEADAAAQLRREGYGVLPGLMSAEKVDALDTDLRGDFARTRFCQGAFYGEHTKRFGSLLKRSRHSAAFVQHPVILDLVEQMLGPWCDTIQLNLTQAIEIHPGAPRQFPHRDQDMWAGVKGEVEYLVNVMWPFTPYREENGATLIYPGSHGTRALDTEQPAASCAVELQPGDALVFLGSTLHGAGANRSDAIRRGMIISYCLGWLKPYENQWLAYPPAVARRFAPELAALVGYRQHRPNLGNFEGMCPSVLLQDRLPRSLGAIDALRPDQAQLATAFRDSATREAGD